MCQLRNSVPGCGGNNDWPHQHHQCATQTECEGEETFNGVNLMLHNTSRPRKKRKTNLKRGEVRNQEMMSAH